MIVSVPCFHVQENEKSKDLIIDQRLHKQIIGSKGETIKEIRDRFNGLQVGFPSPGEKKDIVTLRGPKDDVDKCAAYLKKLCTELVRREGGREGGTSNAK